MIKLLIKAKPQIEIEIRRYIEELYDTLQVTYAIDTYTPTRLDKPNTILFYEIVNEEDRKELESIRFSHEHNSMIVMHDSMQYLFDSFKIKALAYINYVTFNDDLEKLKEILKREAVIVEASYHYVSSFMCFDINPRNVLYVESYHHDVYIHTEFMKLKIRDNLKNYIIENSYLHLIRVHKSFVVNLQYLVEIKGNMIIMKNKEEIPIGNRYKEQLNRVLSTFMK